MKVVIIGGVAGGATAAARLRRNDENAEIILVERGPFVSFANCGLPYHISGVIAERSKLLVTSEAQLKARYRLDVRSRTEAVAIDRSAKTVCLRQLETGNEKTESYDILILSPGAESVRPPIPGIENNRVFTLRNIPDLDRIMAVLREKSPERAVVIGGGYIGLEMAENLSERGLETTVVEGAKHILLPFDPEMAALVEEELLRHGIKLHLADKIARFEPTSDCVDVILESGKRLSADVVLLAIGVCPDTALASAAGIELGATGAIKVDRYLRTSDPAIYAIGDAVEVIQTVSGQPMRLPLAGPANRQGRLAADNICADNDAARKPYKGTLGTAILKVFNLAAACTGLNETQAKALGIPCLATITHSASHATYYPGSQIISLKLIYTPEGRILGAQAVSADGADKRIDVIATAIHDGLSVEDLKDLELAYAPPFGAAKDPVNIAGYVAGNVLNGSHAIIDWKMLHDLLTKSPANVQLIDVRTPTEFARGTIAGARNIEVDQLRERLNEIDPSKPVIIFCQIGLRGYLALRILKQRGFADVRNLTGGYKTYHAIVGPLGS